VHALSLFSSHHFAEVLQLVDAVGEAAQAVEERHDLHSVQLKFIFAHPREVHVLEYLVETTRKQDLQGRAQSLHLHTRHDNYYKTNCKIKINIIREKR
jgi:hypothetical protein